MLNSQNRCYTCQLFFNESKLQLPYILMHQSTLTLKTEPVIPSACLFALFLAKLCPHLHSVLTAFAYSCHCFAVV